MADRPSTMEEALEATRENALEVVTESARLATAGKKAAKAAETGDLRTLRQVLTNLVDFADRASEAVVRASGGWAFPSEEKEEGYFDDGQFERELLAAAKKANLGLYPIDGVLACFPALVRINPRERTVSIDRKPFKFIRPSYLVTHLRSVQAKPGRIAAKPFIESLYRAYQFSLATKKGKNRVVSVIDLYKILTILPIARKDYSQQEFARDLYLLEENGTTETGSGAKIRFHAATGTKSPGQVLRIVNRQGKERLYSSVEFVEGN